MSRFRKDYVPARNASLLSAARVPYRCTRVKKFGKADPKARLCCSRTISARPETRSAEGKTKGDRTDRNGERAVLEQLERDGRGSKEAKESYPEVDRRTSWGSVASEKGGDFPSVLSYLQYFPGFFRSLRIAHFE